MSTTERAAPDYAGAALKASILANPNRLAIVAMLDDAPAGVEDLLGRPGGDSLLCVSTYIGLLRNAGLVDARRSGRRAVYSLTEHGARLLHAVRPLLADLEDAS